MLLHKPGVMCDKLLRWDPAAVPASCQIGSCVQFDAYSTGEIFEQVLAGSGMDNRYFFRYLFRTLGNLSGVAPLKL